MTPTITSLRGNYLLWLLLMAELLSGCMKEDADCPADLTIPYTLTVKAYAHSGEELTRDEVSPVWLYLFDQEGYFETIVQTSLGASVELFLLPGQAYYLIGWGNLGDNTRVVSGQSVEEFSVTLRGDESGPVYSTGADDLFHGSLQLRVEDPNKESTEESGESRSGEQIILPIYRRVGSLRVHVSGLKEYTGHTEGEYSVIVGETPDGITFEGELTGDHLTYRPESGFITGSGREPFQVPVFNLLPREEGIYIDLYYEQELVIRIDSDQSGEPLQIAEGLLTDVEVDLSRTPTGDTSLSVTARLRDWGSEEIGKEF